jgi:hypothetical protein
VTITSSAKRKVKVGTLSLAPRPLSPGTDGARNPTSRCSKLIPHQESLFLILSEYAASINRSDLNTKQTLDWTAELLPKAIRTYWAKAWTFIRQTLTGCTIPLYPSTIFTPAQVFPVSLIILHPSPPITPTSSAPILPIITVSSLYDVIDFDTHDRPLEPGKPIVRSTSTEIS